MAPLRPAVALLTVLACPALAEISVSTDFEGGSAAIVAIDQAKPQVRIMPRSHEGRGWPCWWYLQIDGLTPGQNLHLEVQAQTKPYRDQSVLSNVWCQPKHAWTSADNRHWTPSDPGVLGADKVMTYTVKPTTGSLRIAWGPPFVPSDAETLLGELEAKLPKAQRFVLATTRGGRAVQGIRIGEESAPFQVWIGARQHAWEAGGSQVARGLAQWYASNEANDFRTQTCLYLVPIMDVDNAAIGAGGKDAFPRDHNRDWSDQPVYPEVAAAQRMIQRIESIHGLDVYIDLHNPGPGDPVFFFGPFAFDTMSPFVRPTTHAGFRRPSPTSPSPGRWTGAIPTCPENAKAKTICVPLLFQDLR